MNVYLCARYGRKDEMQRYAKFLRDHGHDVYSTWHDSAVRDDDALTLPEASETAYKAIDEIECADTVIAFTEAPDSPYGRGGRHFELGYAYAMRIRTITVGPRENLFHHMARQHFGTLEGFKGWIMEGATNAEF
jgi:nucleoside 2-deoxyribosyltransferase